MVLLRNYLPLLLLLRLQQRDTRLLLGASARIFQRQIGSVDVVSLSVGRDEGNALSLSDTVEAALPRRVGDFRPVQVHQLDSGCHFRYGIFHAEARPSSKVYLTNMFRISNVEVMLHMLAR